MTGWIAVQCQLVGTLDGYDYAYYWDGRVFQTSALAVSHGFKVFGSDDFNIGQLRNGELVWWGWMDEPHHEDITSAAYGLGLLPQ